jgi:hypothetical protein
MSIDYGSMLTNEQRRQLVESRIAQFAAEAYQHTLNIKTAEQLNNEQAVEAAQKSLETLEAAINVHQEELANIPSDI